MLYQIGLTIVCFLFVVLILKKDKKHPDYILQTWLGVIAMHLGLHYMQYSGLSYKYPHTLGLTLSLPLLHGVLPYFYSISLIRVETLTIRKTIFHLIPFLLLTALAVPFFILPPDQKITVFQRNGEGFEWYLLIQLPVIITSGMVYAVATMIEIRRGSRTGETGMSEIFGLMKYVTFGLVAIWLLSAAFDDSVIFAGVVIFVLFLGLFGISRVPGLYTSPALTGLVADHTFISRANFAVERYARTGLKQQDATGIMQRMEEFMKTKKPYTNFDLTLNDLAAYLNTSPNYLSQVINSVSGKTFYHYINHYRITEFLVLAARQENKKYTFIALAYDCGFNSKTTFNKYFKLHTGQTPSEYFGKQSVETAEPAFA
ncbi:helix-turn-helix domain-containing protein [Dyadobacter diqingensis]|uniref:helix-turn-helix domain-containing protein n=1 Tax=Dyadobacter diqingensis TaxID=2938121 RepID=UPI0020C50B6F|nr:helix-turn-helix transcriptional regulator [Dyadobacter diqingensis]